MMNKTSIFLCLLLSLLMLPACTKSCVKEEAHEQSVSFLSPSDGQKVQSPFEVKFGIAGMTVKPALEDMKDQKSGHHHILLDHPQGFIEAGLPVPADANHIHYGKGETSAMISLPPGTHTISMQFADGAHLSYGKKMAATITVTVLDEQPSEEQ